MKPLLIKSYLLLVLHIITQLIHQHTILQLLERSLGASTVPAKQIETGYS